MNRGLTILCAAKLHANQLERHLELFEHIPEVERVIVARHEPLPPRLSKVDNRPFGGGSRPMQAFKLLKAVRGIVAEENVDWVLGFNPVPWGTIALSGSLGSPANNCLSLIGMDYLQIQKSWGRPFLEAVKRADAVTVTGKRMTEGLIRLGVDESRIFVLPHSVDTNRFVPRATEKQFDLISVGQLIQRKRMDVLLSAVALLKNRGRALSLGILGKGPLEQELREQCGQLGIEELVHFLGYRDDVEQVLAQSRAFCLASSWEGVPFAMIEAMSAGLVPVVTDVGTIADWIRDDENGRIVRVGDDKQLADTLDELFCPESGSLSRLSDQINRERDKLSFSQGARVWREIFGLTPEA